MTDSRKKELETWLAASFPQQTFRLARLAGDASFRQYFRIHLEQEPPLVVMDSPPDKEPCDSFVAIGRHWRGCGIQVPEIMAADLAKGFVLLEDFGDNTLWKATHWQPVRGADHDDEANAKRDGWYQVCLETLAKLQQVEHRPELPLYDEALLSREIDLFDTWLRDGLLSLLPAPEWARLHDTLIKHAHQQPQVTVHRDYHSRNLMVCSEDRIGVLDFQDAVHGPWTYDLISLVKDCYVRWPAQRVEQWQQDFHSLLPRRLRLRYPYEAFREQSLWMGIQRHLKAAGIFARLFLRDGKNNYLKEIPNTLTYIDDALVELRRFSTFRNWLRQELMPQLSERLAEDIEA